MTLIMIFRWAYKLTNITGGGTIVQHPEIPYEDLAQQTIVALEDDSIGSDHIYLYI